MKGLARAQAEMKDFGRAIATYQKLLESEPNDRDSRVGLARVLSWNHQYVDSIRLYREILDGAPDDVEVLEGLASVYVWSNHPEEAIQAYQRLTTLDPHSRGYPLELARLQMRRKNLPAARALLDSLLSSDPHDREARLQLAQLEMQQSHFEDALKQFDQVLDWWPDDFDALLGKAQNFYYLRRLSEAIILAEAAVDRHPDNYDAVFLLASIERAQGKRKQSLAELAHADRLSPHNPEVASMKEALESETKFTLHTVAAFDHELGQAGAGQTTGFQADDLRTFAYGTTLEMSSLPHSESFFSVSYSPSNIPTGYFGGTAGPAEIFYRQRTDLTSTFTLHGGIGMARFGPGDPVNLPDSAGLQRSATERPTALLSGVFTPRKKLHLALTWSRLGVPATPLAVRLGVIESRTSGMLTCSPSRQTELNLEYYWRRDVSLPYDQLVVTSGSPPTEAYFKGPEAIQGTGGSLVFYQGVVHSTYFALKAGYSTEIYGYGGLSPGIFLGYFTPGFYQQHLLMAKLGGKMWGPFEYEFKGGVGLQQIDHNTALTRALILNPALHWKVNPRLTLILGYTYYDTAQALGVVQGNGVRLSTDWKF
jgi:tetratricopeptide (TPR) repeat protein